MTPLKHAVKTFCNDEEGATAIEYGLIIALIAVMIIAGAVLIGNRLNCVFMFVANCLRNSAGCSGTLQCS